MAAKRQDKFNDLGLGTKATAGRFRTLNKDGSFNVRKTNVPFAQRLSFFHDLISMSWTRFLLIVGLSYLCANLLFASLYYTVGLENLTSIEGTSSFDRFMEAFYFSSQTITKLGYGRVAPTGHLANAIAAVESMIGLLAFALATGLLYGRFSKPSARIKYSAHAVMAPYRDINGFMFRVVNPRPNQLMEVEVTVTLSMQRKGSSLRDFHLLELERPKVVFMPSVWTIVHPIGEHSPLRGMNADQLSELDAEFIVMMKAFDESFSQTVYSRSSYKPHEVRWGEKFAYIITPHADGMTVDVGRLDETEPAPLNPQ